MDTDSKASERDTSQLSDLPSDPDSSDSDAAEKQTEWLATTRKRRTTAGNRMKSMLANEEPDSDLELLFAEDDDDQGFSDVGDDGSDVHMDSSSDDEDDNNANDEDLEGERELERHAKEKRAAQRKRKAQEAIPAKFRKKVRIDPTTSSAPTPQPRPKKKSERSSWLPSPADLPTRASSRKTTRISKEQLHQQMAEREAKRLKQVAQMEKKQARLEAMKKPPMTQEERLAEAAIVERRNSKSLNRWEEAEKQREEERRAKLAALNQRTLKGPVITFWSGKGQWDELELRTLQPYVTVVEEKPKKKREKSEKGAGKAKAKEKGKEKAAEKEKQIKHENESLEEVPPEPHKSADNPENGAIENKKADGTDGTTDNVMPGEQTRIHEHPAKDNTDPVQDIDASEKPAEPPAGENVQDEADKPPTLDAENIQTEESNPEAAIPEPRPETEVGKDSEKAPEIETKDEQHVSTAGFTEANEQAGPVGADDVDSNKLSEGTEAAKMIPNDNAQTDSSEGGPQAAGSAAELGEAGHSTPKIAQESSNSGAAPASLPSQHVSDAVTPHAPAIEDAIPTSMDIDNAALETVASKTEDLAPPSTQEPTATSPAAGNSRRVPSEPPAPAVEPSHTDLDAKPPAADARVQSLRDESAPDSKATSPRESEAPAVPEAPRDMNATRNAIIYQNFDETAIRDKTIQTQILFGRKMNRLAKPAAAPICVITNNPARYRDPTTGLPFYNLHAYRELQRLFKGDYRWSSLLGAWTGSSHAARGVPERFLNPNYVKPQPEPAPGTGNAVEQVKPGDMNQTHASNETHAPPATPEKAASQPLANTTTQAQTQPPQQQQQEQLQQPQQQPAAAAASQ